VLKIAIQYLLAYVFIFISALASANTAPINLTIISSFETTPYQITLHSLVDYRQNQSNSISITPYTLLENESLPEAIIEQIKQSRTEIIVTLGDNATTIAQQSFPSKKIMASLITEPEDFKQQNNTTGIYLTYPIDKHFQWIKKIWPQAKRLGVLYNPTENKNNQLTRLITTDQISYALNMKIAKLMKISISNEVKNNANIIIQ